MKRISILLIALLFALQINLAAQTFKGGGFQQFMIGDIEAIVLTDGFISVAPAQPSMAPNVDAKLVADQLAKNYESANGIELAVNILLLKKDDHLILFDTGSGSEMGATGGWLVDNLKKIGITPNQITDIVATHAHPDHIGGLVDASGKSIYPNAVIYLSRIEHEFWTKGTPDFSRSKLKDDQMTQAISQMMAAKLNDVKSQLKLIEDGETLLDCIKIEIAPGHTIGHFISKITSNGQSIVHIADIIHSEGLLFAHPEWGTAFDWDFDLAIKTRINVLRKLHADNSLIFGYHVSYPGIGHIKRIGNDSYDWVPSVFATPQIR